MKKSELQKLIREEITKVMTETYYNPEWKLSSIQGWIKTYAKNKGLSLNLVKQVDKKTDTGRSFAGSKSKTTFYIYDIGDKHGIVIKDDKVAGAPELSEIDVIIGLKGSTPGALSKSHSISSGDGSNQELTKLLDKVLLDKILGTIKKGTDSKPIEEFEDTKLAEILNNIGYPATRVEGYRDINGGPTLSVEFEKELAKKSDFISAYGKYRSENKALGLPEIKSSYHVGGKKWKFQMEK